MFSSLKIKTFFFLTLLMTTTAGVKIIFTHRDVGDAMLKAEKKRILTTTSNLRQMYLCGSSQILYV
jgi:hypothetical protein